MTTENGTMSAILTEKDIQELQELPHIQILHSITSIEQEISSFKEEHDGKELSAEEKLTLQTMEAWLAAYKEEWERRLNYKPPTIQEMTDKELSEAHYEVDDDRKYFCRRRRGLEWTEEDKETYENMNAYAQKLMDEKTRRRESPTGPS